MANDAKTKSTVVDQFHRIITTNHHVNEHAKAALAEAYDMGVKIGTVARLAGDEFRDIKWVKEFSVDSFIRTKIDEICPTRLCNKKHYTYTGPEITAKFVLSIDYDVKKTIAALADEGSNYMYFKRAHADKSWYASKMKRVTAKDDKSAVAVEYNTKEAYIFMLKCYQVGCSVGYNDMEWLSAKIHGIYANTDAINEYRMTNKNTETGKRVMARGIYNDADLMQTEAYVDDLKSKTPNWEMYGEFYNKK